MGPPTLPVVLGPPLTVFYFVNMNVLHSHTASHTLNVSVTYCWKRFLGGPNTCVTKVTYNVQVRYEKYCFIGTE